jgi:protein associated with RNAse G/E
MKYFLLIVLISSITFAGDVKEVGKEIKKVVDKESIKEKKDKGVYPESAMKLSRMSKKKKKIYLKKKMQEIYKNFIKVIDEDREDIDIFMKIEWLDKNTRDRSKGIGE